MSYKKRRRASAANRRTDAIMFFLVLGTFVALVYVPSIMNGMTKTVTSLISRVATPMINKMQHGELEKLSKKWAAEAMTEAMTEAAAKEKALWHSHQQTRHAK